MHPQPVSASHLQLYCGQLKPKEWSQMSLKIQSVCAERGLFLWAEAFKTIAAAKKSVWFWMFCHVYICKWFKVLKDWKKTLDLCCRVCIFCAFMRVLCCMREDPDPLNLGLMDSYPNFCLSDWAWDLEAGPWELCRFPAPPPVCTVSVVPSHLSCPGPDAHSWIRTRWAAAALCDCAAGEAQPRYVPPMALLRGAVTSSLILVPAPDANQSMTR